MHYFRAIVAVLILVGGLLMPEGDMLLAAPAAVIGVLLVVWEVLRTRPLVHWVLVFLPLVFGLLAFHRVHTNPLSDYGDEKFFGFVTLTLFTSAAASLIRIDGGFEPLVRIWIISAVYLTAASLITATGTRAAAYGANPIWVSRAIAVGLVFTAWLYWIGRLRVGWAAILGIVLLVGLFASGSRGPLLGAVVGILVLLFASNVSASRKALTVAVSGLATVVLLQLPIFQESRIVGLATGQIVNDTVRNDMWLASLRLTYEQPGGVGYGNWSAHAEGLSRYNYPHNLFLEVLSEQGLIVGILLIVAVLAVLISTLKKSKHSTTALGAAAWLVTEIVNVSLSGDLNARTFFFALTFAFLVSAWPTPQKDISETPAHRTKHKPSVPPRLVKRT